MTPSNRAATCQGIPIQCVNETIRGKGGVTFEMFWLLVEALRTTLKFWFNVHATYDLCAVRPEQRVQSLAMVGE